MRHGRITYTQEPDGTWTAERGPARVWGYRKRRHARRDLRITEKLRRAER
jgi:hypothetical protein